MEDSKVSIGGPQGVCVRGGGGGGGCWWGWVGGQVYQLKLGAAARPALLTGLL